MYSYIALFLTTYNYLPSVLFCPFVITHFSICLTFSYLLIILIITAYRLILLLPWLPWQLPYYLLFPVFLIVVISLCVIFKLIACMQKCA